MTSGKVVQLGEVLRRYSLTAEIDPRRSYKEITVRMRGKGVVERGVVSGSDLGNGRRFLARHGQFIISKIDARHGANGLVGSELDGAIVTSDFPLFDVKLSHLEPHYLKWIARTQAFIDLCRRASEGTTNRVRLSEPGFLGISVRLPSLEEQRETVAMIEMVAEKLTEARNLRDESVAKLSGLLASREMGVWPTDRLDGAPTLEQVTSHLARGRQSEQGESKHYLIKTQHVQQDRYLPTRMTLTEHVARRVRPDAIARSADILIACSAAGCLGRVARYVDNGEKASTDTHVAIARPNPALIDPDYLYAYLRGAQGQIQLRSRERGDWQREKISFRLTELNLADLRKVPVPVPPMEEQRRIAAQIEILRGQAAVIAKLQAETEAELDALLPAILDHAFKDRL